MYSWPRSPLFCVCLSCWFALSAFAQRPHFNPQQDYAYDLAATDATVVKIELGATGFAWPAQLPVGDTLLLEFVLETSEGDTPTLTATAGGVSVHQVFEAAGKGRRFLDLSAFHALAAGEAVTLTGAGASWMNGSTRLFVYRNAPLAGQRVLVVAPHPDDAEIGAFGLYRRTQADVITVTAGDAGGENFGTLFTESGEQYRIKGWIRTWDSISVPFYGGVAPGKARNLGYYDAVLRKMQAAPTTPVSPLMAKLDDPAFYRRLNVDEALRKRPFQATWEGLVADMLWELKRTKPTLIVAPHPLLDNHPDHQYVTIALIEALAQWRGKCELYLYTNHALENEAFPLGDRAALTGLPASSRADLFFRRIYSHPLTLEEQKLKLVALEDMHDLRAFDLRDGTPPVEEDVRRSWKDYDYYRRGPRPNELFFVLSKEDALRLRESFLAEKKAGPAGPAGK
jgi:LmbE family N-acetylglucosaminyl deacetylase